MKNLQTYDEFLFEESPMYAFDGTPLKVGKSVISFDGYSGIIVSKESVNGKVQYRDHKGVVRVVESYELIEDEILNEDALAWWEVAKGILAADAIKVGVAFAGGGLILGAHLFVKWRQSIANKIEKIKKDKKYEELKEMARQIADKFNTDDKLNGMLADLAKYPYQDVSFLSGKREKAKGEENNKIRKKLMRDISNYVKSNLSPEETQYFVEINKILKDKPLTSDEGKTLEEDVVSDPNRTVGTGTLTPVHHDTNPTVGGTWNAEDPASGGDTFFR
jgi:hypothetical protein